MKANTITMLAIAVGLVASCSSNGPKSKREIEQDGVTWGSVDDAELTAIVEDTTLRVAVLDAKHRLFLFRNIKPEYEPGDRLVEKVAMDDYTAIIVVGYIDYGETENEFRKIAHENPDFDTEIPDYRADNFYRQNIEISMRIPFRPSVPEELRLDNTFYYLMTAKDLVNELCNKALHKKLKEQKVQTFDSIWCIPIKYLDGSDRENICIHVTPKAGYGISEVQAEIQKILEYSVREGFSEREINEAKSLYELDANSDWENYMYSANQNIFGNHYIARRIANSILQRTRMCSILQEGFSRKINLISLTTDEINEFYIRTILQKVN